MNIAELVEVKKNPHIAAIAPGDTVRVSVKVVEGDKERLQLFKGVIIRIRHAVDGGTFTVRRISHGVGVERTFLFQSPLVDRVELVQHGEVRRAKLYYLRRRSGKTARLRERRLEGDELLLPVDEVTEEATTEVPEEAAAEASVEPETKATEET